jgi:lipid-binding SYLF domain-containing protein
MKRWLIVPAGVVLIMGLCLGLATMAMAKGKELTPAQKRAKIDAATKETLNQLLEKSKEAKNLYDKSYGYAVFTNMKFAFFISGGGGSGEAVAKSSGKKTYMKMGTGGIGLGLGGQKYRVIFLFETKEVFDKFIEKGWGGGGGANAAAGKAGANATAEFKNGVAAFQFTKAGLLALADLSGSKFWKYDELN